MRDVTLMSRGHVEDLIARGKTIIIVDNNVLKVDPWLKYHPGGDKAILHMVGRDATDEVNALHSAEARLRMTAYRIGRTEGRWQNFIPPIQGGVFRTDIEQTAIQKQLEDSASDTADLSQESSRSASPLFDPAEEVSSRRRRPGLDRASSVSSLSSEESPASKVQSPSAFINARTHDEIDLDLSKYPPLDSETQDSIVQKYRLLNDRLRAEGLYKCPYSAYAIESIRYTLLFSLSLLSLHYSQYALAGVFMGLFWHQLVFTAHDAGHMGITHNFTVDSVIGILVADFLGGLSIGWWKRNHNVHHIVTNSPEHDPDIEHMPFFAISHRFFTSLRSTYYNRIMPFDPVARFLVRHQALLYYPMLTLGRFNLYRLSWEYLLLGLGPRRGPAAWLRYLEITGQLFFWAWFGYGILYCTIPTWPGRLTFLLVSHMVTGPLHVQITLSHFAMSTADLGPRESFPQKMLRTTMDVDAPAWLDFLHGGLQFQAVHHLFPRIPRHNLRRAQGLVQEFCEEVGIPYALYGFVGGNRAVLGKLGEVGRQARVFGECQRACVDEVVEGAHAHRH